jgi:hypothetical protein
MSKPIRQEGDNRQTIWSWAKTLHEKAYGASRLGIKPYSDDATVSMLLDKGLISHNEIANTPDFAKLFIEDTYAKILREGGYAKRLRPLEDAADMAALSAEAGGRGAHTGPHGTPLTAEGSGLASVISPSTSSQRLGASMPDRHAAVLTQSEDDLTRQLMGRTGMGYDAARHELELAGM